MPYSIAWADLSASNVDGENPAPDGVEQPLGGRKLAMDLGLLDKKYGSRKIPETGSDFREGMINSWREYLTSDPKVCHGQLCAIGSYPSIKPVHIEAALAYAAELAREERLLPVSGL